MDNIGKMGQRAVQAGDHLRRRPFLRPKYRRRALWSRQRVGNIASDVNTTAGQALIKFANVDAREALQRASAGGNLLVIFGQQFRPSACTIPAPPSFVALPPMPIII